MTTPITELTSVLDELSQTAEDVRITRKTLLELSDPAPPAPPTSAPELPGGAAYQEIMAAFAQAGGPLRARGVCDGETDISTPRSAPQPTSTTGRWAQLRHRTRN